MESTLSMTVDKLKAEAGDFLGFGRGALYGEEAWTANKERRIVSAVETALRMVYFATLSGDGHAPASYSWSWLRPYSTVTVAAGGRETPLPADFNGFEGEVAVSQSAHSGYAPVRVDNAEVIRQRYASFANVTGRPTLAAVEPVRGTGPHAGTRFKLLVYPQAEAEYTLGFHYSILPEYLTAANPYPYGGAGLAEVYKAACRAAAELLQDQQQGPEFAHFQACLAAAVSADRRKKPQNMGYNSDTSDARFGGPGGWWSYGRYGYGTITFNGQDPG